MTKASSEAPAAPQSPASAPKAIKETAVKSVEPPAKCGEQENLFLLCNSMYFLIYVKHLLCHYNRTHYLKKEFCYVISQVENLPEDALKHKSL